MDKMNHNMDVKAKDYFQFFMIVLAIFTSSIAITLLVEMDIMVWINVFMGIFFLVFSIFKLFNLKEFVTAFKRYDIIGKKFKIYNYIYPFIELVLGILFIGFGLTINTNWLSGSLIILPIIVGLFTAILMIISAMGVIRVLLKKDTIMCACLGGVIKLPVTHITLFEDLLMAIMGIFMSMFLIYSWATDPIIHIHAGFIVVDENQTVDFSSDRYMKSELCGDHNSTDLTPAEEQLEKAHLHDNDGDVAHIHRKGATWGDFFQNIEYKFDQNPIGYINGNKVEDILSADIGAFDRVIILDSNSSNIDISEYQNKVADRERILEVENKSESCGG